MLLRREIGERTDHMVAHCRLDSASIFLTERSAASANLIHLHHVGITEEVKVAYSDAGVYQDDPFVAATRAGVCEGNDNWYEWGDNRLDPHKAGATRYGGFIDRYGIDVVAAYVKSITPDLYLLIGTHRRHGNGSGGRLSAANLRHEVDMIANLVMAQLFEQTLQHSAGVSAFYQSIGRVQPQAVQRGFASGVEPSFQLSRREQEIAQLICNGKQNKEIAYETGLSGYTVENHLRRIFAKVGVHNRAALVSKMMQLSH